MGVKEAAVAIISSTGFPQIAVENASSVSTTVSSSSVSIGLGATLVAVIMTIIALVTIVGNLVVLLSYYLDKNIRQPHNYFIFSLAVSDLVSLVSVL